MGNRGVGRRVEQPQSLAMAEVADDRLEAGENGASVDAEDRYAFAQDLESPWPGCGWSLAAADLGRDCVEADWPTSL
jgi:hypothetical protein